VNSWNYIAPRCVTFSILFFGLSDIEMGPGTKLYNKAHLCSCRSARGHVGRPCKTPIQSEFLIAENSGAGGKTWLYSILNWTGLGWTGLDWTRLDWTELDWTRLDWTRLDWTELDWTGTRLDWAGLDWTELDCITRCSELICCYFLRQCHYYFLHFLHKSEFRENIFYVQ
jgi:hypothetical protein